MLIRPEQARDTPAIHALNLAAFDTPAEADLVEALREQADSVVSLVAEEAAAIAGHIMFSPVTLPGQGDLKLMGLAPMAVAMEQREQGIGSALVRAGLARCRQLGMAAVVVLGHPQYYTRFGFVPSTHFDIDCEYDAPPEAFMVIELNPGCLQHISGTVKYHPAFGSF